MMNKISAAQAGQMMKMAAENLRALSEENKSVKSENDELREKVAHFEREERIEKIAKAMENKNINSGLSFEEKLASLREHEKLDALEEAVNFSAPQLKLASVSDERQATVEGMGSDAAADTFAASLVED